LIVDLLDKEFYMTVLQCEKELIGPDHID